MYLMYVDESGDPGIHQHASAHFILSGLVIAQDDWQKYLDRLKAFRKAIKAKYRFNQREEIHASELIRVNKNSYYSKIRKTDRINILKNYCSQIPLIFDTAKLINVCLVKSNYQTADEVHEVAWNRLIQRYDTYLKKDAKDKGIIIADDGNSIALMKLLRKWRVYNPVQSHFAGTYNAATDNIIEDVFHRASHHSYFIQTVDVVSHVLYRKEYPKGSLKKYGIEKLFDMLDPILLKKASGNDPFGIVRK